MWAEVKKQTGTARQNVTTASVCPASLKQMASRGCERLFQAVPVWWCPQHLSLTWHCHGRTEKHTHTHGSIALDPYLVLLSWAATFRMAFQFNNTKVAGSVFSRSGVWTGELLEQPSAVITGVSNNLALTLILSNRTLTTATISLKQSGLSVLLKGTMMIVHGSCGAQTCKLQPYHPI